jgi:hypothetical protein
VAAFYFVLFLLWIGPCRIRLDLPPLQLLLFVFSMLFMGAAFVIELVLKDLS